MTSYNQTTPALPATIQPVYIIVRVAHAADHYRQLASRVARRALAGV